MTFTARCGCPIRTDGGSDHCRGANGTPVTYCSRMVNGWRADEEEDGRTAMWAAVEVGDLVRNLGGGQWWEVVRHDVTPFGEIIGVRGTGDVVHWAKTDPTPAEHVAGWRALDPRGRIWLIASRDPSRGTTAPVTPEQAAWRIARLLGGVEIPT